MIRPRSLRRLVLFAALLAGAAAAETHLPSSEWLLDQVRILASPAMEGRRSGTVGGDLAARHIAGVFRDAGLRPGGDAGAYIQAFDVPTGIRLGSTNSIATVPPSSTALVLGRDFSPLAVSDDGEVSADLVFAGYGITAPDLGYDDYAGVDVHGKAVLVLAGEPRIRDPASPFRKPEAYHYAERRHKIINAREHGARLVLLVTDPASDRGTLPSLGGLTQPWGVVAVAITRHVADALVAPIAPDVLGLAAPIDRSMRSGSRAIPGVHVKAQVRLVRERGHTGNVIGVLPGTDPHLAEQTIVVGAHYDHLGHGGEGSLAPDEVGVVHPGADDNASGTAAVMALARGFASAGGAPRTLVFVAFAGEEMGLLGSSEYVRHPVVPLDRTILMVNLDMVGRLRDGKLYVSGVDSGTGLRPVVEGAARGLPLAPEIRGEPFAPSDHPAFDAARRPVLFLFTGPHADYHRPGDTADKINASGLETVSEFASRVIAAVAAQATPPAYVKIEGPVSGGRSSGGYGPFFGVIPDFAGGGAPGVKISGVRAGSPAEKAGLAAGDVLVQLGGVHVKTLDDLMFALRSHRAGDHVDVRWERDGRPHQGDATLEERR